VSPVKNEGTCSASWSFSSIASIESKFSIDLKAGKFSSIQIPKTDSNNFLTFSEQQLIDCDKTVFTCKNTTPLRSLGCHGGYECTAMGFY
jgi:C1A family cysteine protease